MQEGVVPVQLLLEQADDTDGHAELHSAGGEGEEDIEQAEKKQDILNIDIHIFKYEIIIFITSYKISISTMIEQLKKIIKNLLNHLGKYLDLNKILLALLASLLLLKRYINNKTVIPEISMTQFLDDIKKGNFTQAKVASDSIYALNNKN